MNIPTGWIEKQISDIGQIVSGGTPDTTDKTLWDGNIFWCIPSDITKLKSKYLSSTERRISKKGLLNSSANLLPVNSIVLCTRATLGKLAINTIPVSTNQGFKSIIPNRENYFLYIYYLLLTIKREIYRRAAGSTFLEISKSALGKINILLPPLPEQKKLAKILSTWDEGIEELGNLIEKKEVLKKGLMQQLLTGKKRLPGFDGEWKKIKIGDYTILGRGRVISQKEIDSNPGQFPVYSSQTSNEGIMGYLDSFDFEGEYLTWTTDGANAGKVFFRNGKFNCTNVCGTIRSTSLDLPFLAYKLGTITKYHVSYVGNNKLMNGIMASIKIKIPEFNEQRGISQILTMIDNEIKILKSKLEKFKEQKKGLMQVLLTGKIRVKI